MKVGKPTLCCCFSFKLNIYSFTRSIYYNIWRQISKNVLGYFWKL